MTQVCLSDEVRSFLKSDAMRRLPQVTTAQVSLAKQMGIDVAGFPASLAKDILLEVVSRTFGRRDGRNPTEKQVAILQRHGLQGAGLDRYLAGCLIHHILLVADLNAIDEYDLRPGMKVMHSYDGSAYEISSVRADGVVFFKGGNGKKACARNLRPYDKKVADRLRKENLARLIDETGISITVEYT